MSEIKMSPLLARLVQRAKGIGYPQPFTAERFIIAAIDMIKTEKSETRDNELIRLARRLKAKFYDLEAVRAFLMDYILDDNNMPALDELYMQKILVQIEQPIDSLDLLLRIIWEPSDAIKLAINIDKEKREEEIQNHQSEEDPSDSEMPEVESASEPFEEPVIERTPLAVKDEMSCLIREIKDIRAKLQNSVFGQDNAINTFVTGYFQAQMLSMLDGSRSRPSATFLFAGSPGVGKTFLAEKAAEALGLPFMRFDMSEYSEKEASLEFIGSDKVYKNAKEGNVTGFVEKNPRCVLLFDEIEKAHISIIHLFLQLLDAGRLRDSYTDKEVSFLNAIIIFTTNAGKQLYEESESGDFSTVSRKVIIKALQNDKNPVSGAPFFPPAICSRFASGNVVMFNHIGAHNLVDIAKREIERHCELLENQTDIKVQIDESVYTALLFSEGSSADARTIRSRAETFFNDELYELMRLMSSDKVKADVKNIEKIGIKVDLTGASEEIKNLFNATEKAQIILFADDKTVNLCREKLPCFEVIGTETAEDAIKIIKSRNIDLALLDMSCSGSEDKAKSLNAEDMDSPARDFFKFLREQRKELPIYLIEKGSSVLGDEERISFKRQGVRDILCITSDDSFAARLTDIAAGLHHQAGMTRLAKENKLISFETAQAISESGKNAEIRLFDFSMGVVVDSEDAKNVLSAVSKPNVHFDDVIGAQDAKKELTYFVEYLKNPKKYMGTGVKAPKGIILYGPPGTGKTMLAKAMACEADVTFIAAEGNQFLKKLVGEGSEAVHNLFKTARKYAPSILFIDEIDAIAKERRGGVNSGATGEETLTAFLTEMDGFASDPSKPVFVLAATNFDVEPGGEKSLDPALMRRFDRRVYIDLPDKEDRIQFLRMKIANNQALDISEEQLNNIAVRATGMSLAELDSAIELALRSAIREGSTKVNDAILEEAFETFNGGEAKKWGISQLERVARHEAGHALLYWLSGETPSYLTIVSRGNQGGYMQKAESENKALYTKDELLAQIRVALGGRAAEIVYYGQRDGISTGAGGDLASATNIAEQIVCSYGMDDEFGLSVIKSAASANGALSLEVKNAVNRILKEQMDEAIRLVNENLHIINALVKELMVKNRLSGAEIEQVIAKATK